MGFWELYLPVFYTLISWTAALEIFNYLFYRFYLSKKMLQEQSQVQQLFLPGDPNGIPVNLEWFQPGGEFSPNPTVSGEAFRPTGQYL